MYSQINVGAGVDMVGQGLFAAPPAPSNGTNGFNNVTEF